MDRLDALPWELVTRVVDRTGSRERPGSSGLGWLLAVVHACMHESVTHNTPPLVTLSHCHRPPIASRESPGPYSTATAVILECTETMTALDTKKTLSLQHHCHFGRHRAGCRCVNRIPVLYIGLL